MYTNQRKIFGWDSYYRLYYDDDFQNTIYTSPRTMEEPTETTPLTQHTDDDDDADTGNDNQVTNWDEIDLTQMAPDGTPIGEQPPDGTDRTNPFEEGAASTPAGEHIPLVERTRFPQEQQGLHTAETSFNEGSQSLQAIAEGQQESIWEEIGWDFEEPDKSKLDVRRVAAPRSGQGRGGSVIELSMKGRNKWYRFYTKSPGDTEATFNEHLPQEIKNALGKSVDEQLDDTNTALARTQQKLAEKEVQQKRAAERAAESQKLKRDMMLSPIKSKILMPRYNNWKMSMGHSMKRQYKGLRMARGSWKVISKPNDKNYQIYRSWQNKPIRFAKMSTNSCVKRGS